VRRWLNRIRRESRKTQKQVADATGISRAYYTQIERGIRRPSVETAKRIADYLKFDWTYFFWYIKNKGGINNGTGWKSIKFGSKNHDFGRVGKSTDELKPESDTNHHI